MVGGAEGRFGVVNLWTYYRLERTGWPDDEGGRFEERDGPLRAVASAWSLWLSDLAGARGHRLPCGCTRYLGRIRLIAFGCPKHFPESLNRDSAPPC